MARKVVHTGLVFDTRSAFISRSLRALVTVSVCSGCTICVTVVDILTHRRTEFYQLI